MDPAQLLEMRLKHGSLNGIVSEENMISRWSYSDNIDTATPNPPWQSGTYGDYGRTGVLFRPTLYAGSADALPSGTGCRTFRVDGLDENYDPISAVVGLNGGTAVQTAADELFMEITGGECITFGSGLINAGDIRIINAGTGINHICQAGMGRCNGAIYAVRRGYGFWIYQWGGTYFAPTSGEEIKLHLQVIEKLDSTVRITRDIIYINGDGDGKEIKPCCIYVPPKAVVMVEAKSTTNLNQKVSMGFNGLLIKE